MLQWSRRFKGKLLEFEILFYLKFNFLFSYSISDYSLELSQETKSKKQT